MIFKSKKYNIYVPTQSHIIFLRETKFETHTLNKISPIPPYNLKILQNWSKRDVYFIFALSNPTCNLKPTSIKKMENKIYWDNNNSKVEIHEKREYIELKQEKQNEHKMVEKERPSSKFKASIKFILFVECVKLDKLLKMAFNDKSSPLKYVYFVLKPLELIRIDFQELYS